MASDKREYTFAQTFPTGTHAMWLYYWLASSGINPMKDAKSIVVPPPQMVANMRVGNMDGYCVGEPWGHRAIMDGIGITAIDTTHGTWLYTTDSGTTWTALLAVSDASSLLLAANDGTRLYFQPSPDFNGIVAAGITFRAWDQTSGTNGDIVDTTHNGVATAFSTATDTARISVTSVNDVPSFSKGADKSATDESSAS